MSIKSDFCIVSTCKKLRDKKQGSAYCPMHRTRRSRYKSIEIPIRPGLPEGVAMICIHHGERNINQVYKNGGYKYNRCKECRKVSDKRHRENNPDYMMTRNFYFIGTKNKRIRIEKSLYEKLHEEQNGLCKICKQPETINQANKKGIKRLAVDHCHKTGKIRGLLCQFCNQGLGYAKDSIEILESAIKYLKDAETML